MITDIYDLLSPFAIHLNWSTPDHTLRIFQSLLLVTLALFFVSPYLPYRLILLVAGEGALLANHPWVQPTISQLSTRFFSPSRREGRALRSSQRKMMAQLHEWMRMDSLPDEVWERGWRDIEVYENERHSDDAATARAADRHGLGHAGKWSGHALRFGERKVSSGAQRSLRRKWHGLNADQLTLRCCSPGLEGRTASQMPRARSWAKDTPLT